MLIYCGDSHTRPFDTPIFDQVTKEPIFENAKLVWRPGATAGGFPKLHARSGLRKLYEVAIVDTPPTCVCFNLGQVDVDIVYYYKAMTSDVGDFEDWIEARYTSFLDFCTTSSVPYVIKGLNPSCLTSVERIRSHIKRSTMRTFESRVSFRAALSAIEPLVSLEGHASRNAKANQVLKEMCRDRNLPYFDLRAFLGRPEMEGLAKDEMLSNKFDVHVLDSVAVLRAYREGLKSVLNQHGYGQCLEMERRA